MLCSSVIPTTPQGTLISHQLLAALLARCREAGALLVVDQCFLELSPGEPDRLVRELEGGGLLLLRALTKSYAMAGLRLGYCLSDDRTLLAAMAEEGPPWPGVTAGTTGRDICFTECAGLAISRPPAVGGERGYLSRN